MATYGHCSHCAYELLWFPIHHPQTKYKKVVYSWNMLEKKIYIWVFSFFHLRFFLWLLWDVYFVAPMFNSSIQVHDIKSLVHTLEGIGNVRFMSEKLVKTIFYWIHFLFSFVDFRGTNVRKFIACVCKIVKCIDGKC